MKRSKYKNQVFTGGWKCVECFIAANYYGGTKHNAYRYQMVRLTSDGKFDKIITVSGTTMAKVARGELNLNDIAENKLKSGKPVNEVLYKFKTKKETE